MYVFVVINIITGLTSFLYTREICLDEMMKLPKNGTVFILRTETSHFSDYAYSCSFFLETGVLKKLWKYYLGIFER